MTVHDHRTYVDGCYRCELSRDEAMTTPADIIEQALLIATDDVQHLGGVVVEALDAAGFDIVARQPDIAELAGREPLYCLGTTKDGSPRHPLYVKADAPLVRFWPRGEDR